MRRASRRLDSAKVSDDVNGLSAGTALAILLWPAGLALVPERSGADLQYRVRKAVRDAQSWPIGWKPEKRASEVLPRLFEFLNVEITSIPTSQAVEAIQERLEVPAFYDRNALALFGIDPANAGRTAQQAHQLQSDAQSLAVAGQAQVRVAGGRGGEAFLVDHFDQAGRVSALSGQLAAAKIRHGANLPAAV